MPQGPLGVQMCRASHISGAGCGIQGTRSMTSRGKDSEPRHDQDLEARISRQKTVFYGLGESPSEHPRDARQTLQSSSGWEFSDHKLCEGSVIPGPPLHSQLLLAQQHSLLYLPFSEPPGVSGRLSCQPSPSPL